MTFSEDFLWPMHKVCRSESDGVHKILKKTVMSRINVEQNLEKSQIYLN